MGIETEYALAQRGHREGRSSVAYLAEKILRRAYSDLDCLRSESGHGLFLANGAFLYVDVGAHLEYASAETNDPLEATRQVFAGDRLAHELLQRVTDEDDAHGRASLLKTNVDNRGATWGSHESYAVVTRPHDFAVPLASFLATRIVFAGAGGLDQRGRTLRFALSPRAGFIVQTISGSSTHSRGILHDKHEPLACAPFQRLHLTCGDSLRSHYATWLRLATTSLVISALEGGARPGQHALLPLPVKALHAINLDTRLRARLAVASGARRTALDIQRVFVDMVELAGSRGLVPSWWPAVCREWRAVLDALERDPAELAGRLDWPLRLQLFEAYLASKGLSWQQVRVGPSGKHETPLLPWGDILEDPEISAWFLGSRGRRRARRARARSGDSPLAEALREIDLRFGELGPDGLHARLDAAGAITHRLFDESNLARGAVEAPMRGRARVRGAAVRQLARRRSRHTWASWSAVHDGERGAYLDLRHPLRDRVSWQARSEDDVPF